MKDTERILENLDSAFAVIEQAIVEEKKKEVKQKKQVKKWVEVVPHGLVGGMVPDLCLMVFKEKRGSKRFALSLSHLQGQISVQQSMNKEEPFRFIANMLSAMKVRLERCYFLKSQKGGILAKLVLSGHPELQSLDVKAGDVIAFAIYSGCRFFCTEKFIMDMLDQKMERPLSKKAARKPLYLN